MKGKIFLLDSKNKLVTLEESPYDSEDLLQNYLAEHPDLLAGDQINDAEPRKWLLIRREKSVPDKEGGSGRWAVDHLFVDQDGVPTLVEVKRSSDTRIRREVVGQLLEYGANAVAYWPIETIRAEFEQSFEDASTSSQQVIREFLGPDADEEEFWDRVKTNLQLGRIRLLFVADKVSSELQRIVEYLNEQMRETEVLAVEIRQFEGEGQRTLVPRVIGQTAAAKGGKGPLPPRSRRWDKESFLARLVAADLDVSQRILEWAERQGFAIEGGRGAKYAGLSLVLNIGGESLKPLYLYEGYENKPPALHIQFDEMGPRFQAPEMLKELADRLNRLPEADISPDKSYPGLPFTSLREPDAVSELLKTLDWLVSELKGG